MAAALGTGATGIRCKLHRSGLTIGYVRLGDGRALPVSGGAVRYFFNEFDGSYKADDAGLELPSMDDARLEAVRYAGEVLRDHPILIWKGEDFRVEVTDENQLVLFTVLVVGIDAPAGGRSLNRALRPS